MAGHVIQVPQDDGEIVVTIPGLARIPLEVVEGRVTVHDDDLAAAVLAGVPDAVALDEPASDFDPAQHTVAEVNDHLDRHPDEIAAVLAAEAGDDGRHRAGILDGRHAPAEPGTEPAATGGVEG